MGEQQLVGLVEDVADLRAQLRAVTARLDALAEPADALPAVDGEGDTEDQTTDAAEAPPFIFRLEGAEYAAELRALIEWVEGVLVPGYLDEPSPEARWCPHWWEHPAAVARLHALWLAWQELTEPAAGYTGPSTWHRDHLDPCLRELRSSTGPFQGCTKSPHTVAHRGPEPVPSAWHQPDA